MFAVNVADFNLAQLILLKKICLLWIMLNTWIYRRLSLSQGPRYQTKYFEISVVWDSQSVTSFTFFMYVELQLARKQSRTVELRNVTDSTLFIHSQIGCDQCLFCTPFPQVYLWYTLINLTQFLQPVGYVCCLHKRTPLNCSVIKTTNAPLCTHGFYSYTPNCFDY